MNKRGFFIVFGQFADYIIIRYQYQQRENPMIKVENLVFDYMTKRALHGLSFEIEKGSIIALIGPNGAGKTTLMRCLAGLVKPFSGEIFINGINVPENSREAHRHVSYLSDVFGLYDNLTAEQCLHYAALAFDVPQNEIKSRIEETAEQLDLTAHLNSYAGNLSRGLRQRLAIALGIIHKPEFIILDEPASGLDPEARLELSKLFVRLKEQGHTLLISSHILAELEDYATGVIVLNAGRITRYEKFDGSSVTLRQDEKSGIAVRVKGSPEQLIKFMEEDDRVSDVSFDGTSLHAVVWGGDDELCRLLRTLIAADFKIVEFKSERNSLKTAYFETLKEGEQNV